MSLINTFNKCLNSLRDNEALTGDKALRELSYLLILKLIEPQLTDLNLIDFNYDFDDLSNDESTKLLNIIKFSQLIKEPEENLKSCLNNLWQFILAVHPKTKIIFASNKVFEIRKNYTFKLLIEALNKINLNELDYDILGNIYEKVISNSMAGNGLGQYFTQNEIKKVMINLINPKLHSDGTIESVCDPTMGTAGFLISYINDLKIKSKEQNISLDWEKIKTSIYGQEIERDTYQLAISNMLISTGHIFDHLKCGDSIRDPIIQKFDNILANPPFGIDGINYAQILLNLQTGISKEFMSNKYIPIKSNSAVSLFIEIIIYMLKLNGKCAVVIPSGKEVFSKNNKSLIAIREYLLRTCDLQEIIYLPSGIFTYTNINTCIFYFVKKVEIEDTLQLNIKYSKTTNKELSRTYNYSQDFQTKSVKFYEYSYEKQSKDAIALKDKILLIDVSIEQLIKNKFSLNSSEYIESIKKSNYGNNIEVKTLGELCKFLSKSKRKASYGDLIGEYKFYTSSLICNKYVDEPDYNEESLIIGDGGCANINYDILFSASDHCYILRSNSNLIKLKYIYYYLLTNIDILENGFRGAGLKNIAKKYILDIKIPIISLEKQKYIIEYFEKIQKENEKKKQEIEDNNKMAKEMLNNMF